jgi:hypothetical protein
MDGNAYTTVFEMGSWNGKDIPTASGDVFYKVIYSTAHFARALSFTGLVESALRCWRIFL